MPRDALNDRASKPGLTNGGKLDTQSVRSCLDFLGIMNVTGIDPVDDFIGSIPETFARSQDWNS